MAYESSLLILPLEYIPSIKNKYASRVSLKGCLAVPTGPVYTLALVNSCTPGGGESCVVRVCVYIYINCPLKNVIQLGFVLQGILMRCVLHFRV